VLGQDSEIAIGTLQGAGFDVEVIEEETLDPANENRVLGQDPAGGSEAEPGSTVTISVGRFSLGRTDGEGGGNGRGNGGGNGGGGP
jgi:serine/threonine-protein kinase